jgi:cell division transport system permease protein
MGTLNTTWKHIRRSPIQAAVAIITIFLAFLLGGFFFLVSLSSAHVLSFFEGKPQITVFFDEKSGQAEADKLKNTLESTGKIQNVKYVSKEDALEIYREQNKNDPLLLELVNADILPASLEITAKDPKFLKDLEPEIRKATGVEEVIYQRDVVDSLISWTNAIRLIGAVLAGLLIFDSILIIFTVIGMKISLKKEEIEVLKLVGASSWYIRIPFIAEGGFYGLVGSGLAGIVLVVLILVLRTYIMSFLGVIPLIQNLLTDPLAVIFLASASVFMLSMICLGLILGMAGSLLSVSRYLKL